MSPQEIYSNARASSRSPRPRARRPQARSPCTTGTYSTAHRAAAEEPCDLRNRYQQPDPLSVVPPIGSISLFGTDKHRVCTNLRTLLYQRQHPDIHLVLPHRIHNLRVHPVEHLSAPTPDPQPSRASLPSTPSTVDQPAPTCTRITAL